MTRRNLSGFTRVAVVGPRWCPMYVVWRNGALVSLSFSDTAVRAVIDPTPTIYQFLENGADQ